MDAQSPSPRSQPADRSNGATTLAAKDIPSPTSLSPTTERQFDLNDDVAPLRPGIGRLQAADGLAARRPSVQFVPQSNSDGGERSRSRKPARESTGRRLSSPPPPTQFKARVSFDTFDNRDASDFSLTLSRKHKDYVYSKRSRTFLCGTDANEYSDTALEWLIDELVDDGDEIVCLRVVERDSKEAREWAGGNSGKEGRERGYRAEAQRMLERIQEKNSEDRSINLVLEFSIGKVQETIQQMIRIYEPAMLVVGTRGRSLSGFQGLMPGSVSKYCLQHSPIPVVVVRPSSKRDKKKRKRLRDPARRGYRDILDKSEDAAEGGHLLDSRNRRSIVGTEALSDLGKRDAEEEARMVAEAIGYKSGQIGSSSEGAPLSKVISSRSEVSTRSARSGSLGSYGSTEDPEDVRSPTSEKLMKSPELRDLDSPPDSDEGYSEEDSDDENLPPYVLAQREALMKARERAIKAEEEERELEMERLNKENRKPGRRGAKSRSNDDDVQSASGALALLDQLGGADKKGKR